MIIKDFIKNLKYKFILNDLFFMSGKLPKTDDEKYWFSRGMQVSVNDLIQYKSICDKRYKSLIKALSQNGIEVMYDEATNIYIIKNNLKNKQ